MNTTEKQDMEIPLLSVNPPESPSKRRNFEPQSHFSHVLLQESSYRKYESNFSFLSYLTYFDVWNILKEKPTPKTEDIPAPYDELRMENKIYELDKEWQKEVVLNSPDIGKALFRVFKDDIYKKLAYLFVCLCGRFFTILLLGKIIRIVAIKEFENEMDKEYVTKLAIAYAVVELLTKLALSYFLNTNQVLGAGLRLSLIGLLYKKLHSISLSHIKELNIGKTINLIGNNLNELEATSTFLLPAVLSPLTIIVATYFMWGWFGSSSLISICLLTAIMYSSSFISRFNTNPKALLSSLTENRIKLTTEFIEGIKLLKFYAWEKIFKTPIEAVRVKEVQTHMRILMVSLIGTVLSECSVFICIYTMCTVYTLFGGLLTTEKVYTSFMLLYFIKFWAVTAFQAGSSFYFGFRALQQRIQDLLLLPDVISPEESSDKMITDIKAPVKEPIIFTNYTAHWSKKSQKPCLQDINITIKPGTVTAVVGKIGSGKTSFLHALLREIPITQGSLSCSGSIAYVEQDPLIFSGTIRSNILFGRKYDDEFYEDVLRKCKLFEDLADLPKGDLTLVGERGMTLTSSQKARISLARALYSNSDIYLLDDPLSAMDIKVASHLFKTVIKGDLRRSRTVILVTRHLTFAQEADNILFFEEGKIVAEGTWNQLRKYDLTLLNLVKVEEPKEDKKEEERSEDEDGTESISEDSEQRVKAKAKEKAKLKDKAIRKEESTDISFDTYITYLKAHGKFDLFKLILIIYAANHVTMIAMTRFMGYWAMEQEKAERVNVGLPGFSFHNVLYSFWGLIILGCIIVGKYAKNYLISRYLLICNTNIHTMMLRKIMRSIILFFDETPIGVILNRFSSDLGNCDKDNFRLFNEVLEGLCYLALFSLTMCYVYPLVVIPTILVTLLLHKIRTFFEAPIMATRKLDFNSRTSMNSEISQTVNGLSIIRVFKQSPRFITKYLDLIYDSVKAFQFQLRTMRLFLLSVDMSIYLLTISSLFIYIYIAYYSELDAAWFGLALTLVIELLDISGFIMKSSIKLDLNMQSAQRMLDYENLREEGPEVKVEHDAMVRKLYRDRWPHRGEILFRNVFLRYKKETTDFALNGLNLIIQPGTKVACVGRTGAGKSSLIHALFRMVEIEIVPEGCIKIDRVDTQEIGLEMLRQRLSIIPQTALIFNGTIRRNLDPLNKHRTEELWDALEAAALIDFVEKLPKRLETEVTPELFSAAQKQLLCFARAYLRKGKIVVVEEPTSNDDLETEEILHAQIQKYFKDCTVLTITHKLTNIAHYDKVLVMASGKIKEYESPYLLLVNDPNDHRITSNSYFARMVKRTGESVSKKIYEKAKAAFFEKMRREREAVNRMSITDS